MMISYNSERSQHWNDQEVSDLISIWGQDDVQSCLDGTRRNSNAFSLISERLALKGIHRSPAQVRDKIKTLKRDYRTVRSMSDPQRRRAFRFYSQLDSVLNRSKNSNSVTCNPAHVIVTSAYGEDAISAGDHEEESLDTVSSKDSDNGGDGDELAEPQVILDEHPSSFHFQGGKCGEIPSPTSCNSAAATTNYLDIGNPAGQQQTSKSEADSRGLLPLTYTTSIVSGHPSSKTPKSCGGANSKDGTAGAGPSAGSNSASSAGRTNLEMIIDRFVVAQKEIVSKFVNMEEARMKQECALEEKRHAREMAMLERMMDYEQQRRREEREHEMKIFGMLSQFLSSLQGRSLADGHSPSSNHSSQGLASTQAAAAVRRKSRDDSAPSILDAS